MNIIQSRNQPIWPLGLELASRSGPIQFELPSKQNPLWSGPQWLLHPSPSRKASWREPFPSLRKEVPPPVSQAGDSALSNASHSLLKMDPSTPCDFLASQPFSFDKLMDAVAKGGGCVCVCVCLRLHFAQRCPQRGKKLPAFSPNCWAETNNA